MKGVEELEECGKSVSGSILRHFHPQELAGVNIAISVRVFVQAVLYIVH
jgi:hypothetical protein